MGCTNSVPLDSVESRTHRSDAAPIEATSATPTVAPTTSSNSDPNTDPTMATKSFSANVPRGSTNTANTNATSKPAASVPKIEPTSVPSIESPASMSTPSRDYTVFISHAGEDKATIAIPLRHMLRSQGITAFVDDEDIPRGCDAQKTMITAMETAKVAVIVLSPEFLAREWPMKELMCFLRRRGESSRYGVDAPVIIPFFYRLQVGELCAEPRVDRIDMNGNPLYHASRFFERMKNGEPEANIANIKAALQELHGFMGVRNDLDASNGSSFVMYRRRELLIQQLCVEIRKATGNDTRQTVDASAGANGSSEVKDAFRAHYHTARDASKLVLSFLSANRKDSATPEHKILGMVDDCASDKKRVIAVYGIAGVGKTSILGGLMTVTSVRHRFKDGIYLISLGMEATKRRLIETLRNEWRIREVTLLPTRCELIATCRKYFPCFDLGLLKSNACFLSMTCGRATKYPRA